MPGNVPEPEPAPEAAPAQASKPVAPSAGTPGLSPKKKSPRGKNVLPEMVGIEVGAPTARGIPAVRISRRSNGIAELVAADYLQLPGKLDEILALPENNHGSWVLPKSLRAPGAAFAVTAPDAILRQSDSVSVALADVDAKSFRGEISKPEGDWLPFVAAMPDGLAHRVASLLPESKRPTAVSVQVSPLAMLNAFLASKAMADAEGTAMLIAVGETQSTLAIFHEYAAIMYRTYPVGSNGTVKAVADSMNVDLATAKEMIEGKLVDPTPFLAPILGPLFRQVELSSDYALRKSQCFIEKFFTLGLDDLIFPHWNAIFSEQTHNELTACNPVDGVPMAQKGAFPSDFKDHSADFAAAYGAALAALPEVNA